MPPEKNYSIDDARSLHRFLKMTSDRVPSIFERNCLMEYQQTFPSSRPMHFAFLLSDFLKKLDRNRKEK